MTKGNEQFNIDAFANAIPDLVLKSVAARNPKDGRKAQRQLLSGLQDPQTPLACRFQAIYNAQGLALSTVQPRHITGSMALIDELIAPYMPRESLMPDLPELDEAALGFMEKVHERHKEFENDNSRRSKYTDSYKIFFSQVAHRFLNQRSNVIKGIAIRDASVAGESDLDLNILWNTWGQHYAAIISHKNLYKDTGNRQDMIVTLLKEEPAAKNHTKLFLKAYGSISLEDIEEMQYPLHPEQIQAITTYMTALFGDRSDPGLLLSTGVSELMGQIRTTGSDLKNRAVLTTLIEWQDHIREQLIFGGNTSPERRKMKTLITRLPGDSLLQILDNMRSVSLSLPSKVMENTASKNAVVHLFPIARRIYEEVYKQQYAHWKEQYFGDWPGFHYQTVVNRIVPLFFERMDQYDIPQEVKNYFSEHIQDVTLFDPDRYLPQKVKEAYDQQDPSVLPHLDAHAETFAKKAKRAWDGMRASVHFIPLDDAVEIVKFDENTTAGKFGIRQIHLSRYDTSDDWGMVIRVDLPSEQDIVGRIAPDGTLSLNVPLETISSGLFEVIRYTAVLACQDLTAQKDTTKIREEEKKGVSTRKNQPDVLDDAGNEQRGILPRVRAQSSHELSDALKPSLPKNVRDIPIHPYTLPGAKPYEDAFKAFQFMTDIALKANWHTLTPEQVSAYYAWMQERTQLLQEKSAAIHKPHQLKVENWPPHLEQVIYQDPLTQSAVHLKTWVIKHETPKLTTAQQAEVSYLKRFYEVTNNKDTALANLDDYALPEDTAA